MNQENVSARYARALFEIALERNLMDIIQQDMQSLTEVITSSPQLLEWLLHPTTAVEEKKKFFSTLLKETNSVTLHFLFVVMDHHREDLLMEITSQFNRLVHEEKGEVEAIITSAFSLTDKDKEELTQIFQKKLGKVVVLKNTKVDSDLLGGAIVQIGDQIFDGSLKTKLTRFQERVRKAT